MGITWRYYRRRGKSAATSETGIRHVDTALDVKEHIGFKETTTLSLLRAHECKDGRSPIRIYLVFNRVIVALFPSA